MAVITDIGSYHEVFLYRHCRIRLFGLCYLYQTGFDDFMGFFLIQDLTVEFDGAFHQQQPRDGFEEGRFSGAVSTEQGNDFSFGNG